MFINTRKVSQLNVFVMPPHKNILFGLSLESNKAMITRSKSAKRGVVVGELCGAGCSPQMTSMPALA
jgi:hypothetical protein